MLAVASIVLVISLGWRFSGYLNEAANGHITKDILFLIMFYRLPGFLELIIPISFFLAIMLAYGRLHADSEMIILASCGMGPARLILITLSLAVAVMLLTGIFSLWLKPSGEVKVEILFADQRNLTEFDLLAPGRFQTLRSGKRVTYAENLDDDGRLDKVFINEYRSDERLGPKEVVTVKADSGATIVDANGSRFLVLKNGSRYTGKPGSKNFQIIRYGEFGQLIEKEQAASRQKRRTAIPTADLLQNQTTRNLSELYWRLSIIMMVPVIALMAIPLSKVNPRQGRFTRLVPGMILCFLYVVSLSAARSALENGQIPIAAGLWWIHGIYLTITLCLFNTQWFTGWFPFSIGNKSAE